MPVRVVESRHNAKLKELRRALTAPGREALVGVEGPKLLEEAIRAELRIVTVFVARGSEALLKQLHLAPEIEVLVTPRELLEAAMATDTPQPVAALVHTPEWTWAHVLPHGHGRQLVLVLAGLQDPGNLGTIVRSAEAFGANGIVCLPGTVSAWNPKAVRASAGSVFRVPVIAASAKECFMRLREAKVKVWATAARGAATAECVNLEQAAALLIGNEGNGVPEEVAAQAEGALTIPCPGPVESLNAAVAAGVLLYEAARQREAMRQQSAGDPGAAPAKVAGRRSETERARRKR